MKPSNLPNVYKDTTVKIVKVMVQSKFLGSAWDMESYGKPINLETNTCFVKKSGSMIN